MAGSVAVVEGGGGGRVGEPTASRAATQAHTHIKKHTKTIQIIPIFNTDCVEHVEGHEEVQYPNFCNAFHAKSMFSSLARLDLGSVLVPF